MKNRKQNFDDSIKFFLSLVISFLAGSIFLCIFASLQKIYIGTPLLINGYITPFFFGGFSAMLLWIWHRKYRLLAIDLRQLNVELEGRVADRTSELKKSIDHIKESEQFFQSSLDGLLSCIAIIDEKGKIVQTNKSWKDFANNNGTVSDLVSEGVNYIQVCEHATGDNSEEAKIFEEGIKQVLRSEKLTFSLEYPCHTPGIKRWFVGEVTRFPNDKVKNAIISHMDISKRKRTEEVVKTERRRLADVLEATNVGIWEWNTQTGETLFNERWAEIIGYTLEEISPVSIETWTKFCHLDDLKVSNELLEKHFNGELEYYDCETRMRHKNGNWIWVHDRGKVSTWTDDGKPLILSGTHQEITGRKQAEEQIKNLLQQKEILLKEVHHRIRNNMSTIKGLLSLQSRTLNNAEAKMALKEAQNRVESMLVLYDKLFLSSDFQNVSSRQYFETLIDEIIKNFFNKDIVSVTYEIKDVMLGAKIIFNLGLIINELITNTMKHAFVGKELGKINASLSIDEGHATMTIQDDGTELPESVSFENPASGFGFKLVSMLVNQLDGSIQIERGNGTKFTIKFNIET